MNRRQIFFLACTAFYLTCSWSAAIADGTSYPMVCRGGGDMKAMYGRAPGKTIFSIKFSRASQGANVRQPAAGQCAWLDRALTPDEQLELRYEHKDNKITNLDIRKGSITVGRYEGSNGGYDLKYLVDGTYAGQLFNIQARKAKTPWGSYYLNITRVGP